MDEPQAVVVVSGLPRSGTSLVMGILQAGGYTVLSDNARAADESNPRGYWEYGPVKQLARDQAWLPEARGKAVKIVSPLLPYLPDTEQYRIILVERRLEEVLASQRAMLARLGQATDESGGLAAAYEALAAHLDQWLPQQTHMTVLRLSHQSLMTASGEACAAINAFLGGGLDEGAMAQVIDPALYRERA